MMVKLEFVMITVWCACQTAEGELVEQWNSGMELECGIGTALFSSNRGDFGKKKKNNNCKPYGDLCPWWVGREWKVLEWEWRNVVILHRQKCNSCWWNTVRVIIFNWPIFQR